MEVELDGPWADLAERYQACGGMPARNANSKVLGRAAAELQALWQDVDNALRDQVKPENMSGNDDQNERHHQNSNPDSFLNSEQCLQGRLEEMPAREMVSKHPRVRAFSLSLVLQACPDVAMYTKGGAGISTWRDLIAAAGIVRPTLGISPSAWAEACEAMGEEQAAIVLAAILQRHEMIRNAGAYLRNLTERAKEGQFSVGPMIMALLRATVGSQRNSA